MQPELAFTGTHLAGTRGITSAYCGSFWKEVTYMHPRTCTIRI